MIRLDRFFYLGLSIQTAATNSAITIIPAVTAKGAKPLTTVARTVAQVEVVSEVASEITAPIMVIKIVMEADSEMEEEEDTTISALTEKEAMEATINHFSVMS